MAFKGALFSGSDSQSSATEDGDVKILLYTLGRRTKKKNEKESTTINSDHVL